jgi:hypothetical protein
MPKLANRRHELFANLIARGESHGRAYIDAGYPQQSIESACASSARLLKDARVKARIEELKPASEAKFAAKVEEIADSKISSRANRIAALERVWMGLQAVIGERARYFIENEPLIPGGSSGLLTRKPTAAGIVYQVDAGLLTELRATAQQAAQELGQWIEKHDETLNVKSINDLPLETVNAMIAEAEKQMEKARQVQ